MSKVPALLLLVGVGLLIAAAWYSPGSDAEEGSQVPRILLVVFGATALVFGVLGWMMDAGGKIEARERQQFRATALPATARILKIQPGKENGSEVDIPVILTLEVMVAGQTPYVTTHAEDVSRAYSGQSRPDEWLLVGVSSTNRDELYIRWGEAATPPVGAAD